MSIVFGVRPFFITSSDPFVYYAKMNTGSCPQNYDFYSFSITQAKILHVKFSK